MGWYLIIASNVGISEHHFESLLLCFNPAPYNAPVKAEINKSNKNIFHPHFFRLQITLKDTSYFEKVIKGTSAMTSIPTSAGITYGHRLCPGCSSGPGVVA